MQHDQPHPVQHPLVNPGNNAIADIGMRCVAPPRENVGLRQNFFRQAVFRLQNGFAGVNLLLG